MREGERERGREGTEVQKDWLPWHAHMTHQCTAPSSAHHQAPNSAPGPGVPGSCIDEVGPNQALHAAATCVLPAKSHMWALAQGVTLKWDPTQAMSQKMKKMWALLVRALAAMENQEMKVQMVKAPAVKGWDLAVRLRRSQEVTVAAVPQSEEETGKVQPDGETPGGPSEANPNALQAIHCQKSMTRTLKMSGRTTAMTSHAPRT